jgi:hypothetical protein
MKKLIDIYHLGIEKYNIQIVLLFGFYFIYDLVRLQFAPIMPDVGVFLTNARDLVQLSRTPGVDTFGIYTPIGYLFYSIPFMIYKDPSIYSFYVLNLGLFIMSAIIAYKLIESIIIDKTLVFAATFSFFYSFHGLIYDIKLENVVLFVNLFILFLLIISKPKGDFVRFVLVGFLCALAFFTKQYAGLSLVYSIIYLLFINTNKNKLKDVALVLLGFVSAFSLFIVFQRINGIAFTEALMQLKGDFKFQCTGINSGGVGVYGDKKWSNLLVSFKYFRLNLLLQFLLFIGMNCVISKKDLSIVRKIGIVIFILFVMLLGNVPFYFQMFPHYVNFGLPFLIFFLLALTSNYINTTRSVIVKSSINIFAILMFCLFGYTFLVQKNVGVKLAEQKQQDETFCQQINDSIKRGSKVFMLNNRQLWFAANFITPVPKTMGYSWAGLSCLQEAVRIEKPNEFWIGDIHDHAENISLADYSIDRRYKLIKGKRKFFGLHFTRNGNLGLNNR